MVIAVITVRVMMSIDEVIDMVKGSQPTTWSMYMPGFMASAAVVCVQASGFAVDTSLRAHRHGHHAGDGDGHRGDNRRDLHALRR